MDNTASTSEWHIRYISQCTSALFYTLFPFKSLGLFSTPTNHSIRHYGGRCSLSEHSTSRVSLLEIKFKARRGHSCR